MQKSFKITPKGNISTLLQTLSESKKVTVLASADPFASCLDMVAVKRPQISLS